MTRSIDLVARYGGEEFVLLLPETPKEKALIICERIRVSIETFDWQKIHPDLKITISIGVADSFEIETDKELLERADARLYEAKRGGRNQVKT
jgi:two-component system, cell cycle response regulator